MNNSIPSDPIIANAVSDAIFNSTMAVDIPSTEMLYPPTYTNPPATAITTVDDQSSPEVVHPSVTTTASGRKPVRRWTEAEDNQLADLIAKYQEEPSPVSYDANGLPTTTIHSPRKIKIRWTRIADFMEHRTSKQCRERYVNNMKPGGKKGEWTSEEDEQIMRLQKEWGNKWTKIAKSMEGRGDNDVKNRWNAMNQTAQRRRKKSEDSTSSATAVAATTPVAKRRKTSSPSESLSDQELSVCNALLKVQNNGITPNRAKAAVDLFSLSQVNTSSFDTTASSSSPQDDALLEAAEAIIAPKVSSESFDYPNPDSPLEDPTALEGIQKPGKHDVITGRGGGTNLNPGNIKFRRIVEDLKPTYQQAKRTDKPVVAMNVVKDWRALNPPGRFLARNKFTRFWDDIGDETAREKCSQALREKHSNKLFLSKDGNPIGYRVSLSSEEIEAAKNESVAVSEELSSILRRESATTQWSEVASGELPSEKRRNIGVYDKSSTSKVQSDKKPAKQSTKRNSIGKKSIAKEIDFRTVGVRHMPSGNWQVEVFYHGCKRSMGTYRTQDHAALANMTARQILDRTNDVFLSAEDLAGNIDAAKKAGKSAVQQSGGQVSAHGNSYFGTDPSERRKEAKKAIAGMKQDLVAPELPMRQTEITLPPVEQVMQPAVPNPTMSKQEWV